MNFAFRILKRDGITRARLGIIKTPHGKIDTPAFSPVGTKAAVKGLTSSDLENTETQVVLGNTYHLFLQPGVEVIDKFGGFAKFMVWKGPTITDSGGYQVSFLWDRAHKTRINSKRKIHITDMGMYFRSHIDGTKQVLTPEKSMFVQNKLGADIIMAFDQPLSDRLTRERLKDAFYRTMKWEEESFKYWQKNENERKSGSYQALFGIIQGETDKALRRESLKFILSTGFPGLAIGGASIGVSPEASAKSLDTIIDILPDNKPLHALGLGGGPEGVFVAVERGVDIFDNSSVTRMARTGLLLIYPEDGGNTGNKFRFNIERSVFKDDKTPISKICNCMTCCTYSKAYVHHLLVGNDPLGVRLTTIHNICFYNDLMTEIRKSISNGDFQVLKKEWIT